MPTGLHNYISTYRGPRQGYRECATHVSILCPALATYVYILCPVRVGPMCGKFAPLVPPMCPSFAPPWPPMCTYFAQCVCDLCVESLEPPGDMPSVSSATPPQGSDSVETSPIASILAIGCFAGVILRKGVCNSKSAWGDRIYSTDKHTGPEHAPMLR